MVKGSHKVNKLEKMLKASCMASELEDKVRENREGAKIGGSLER